MAEITAGMVKELRECTGAGMMECKKALSEAEGELNTAIDILRTRGLAALAKKAGRATNEGTIAAFVSQDTKVGVLVEVNSETDFVGRNDEFTSFAAEIAEHIAAEIPTDIAELLTQTISSRGITVEQLFGEKVSKLGENMGIARFVREEIDGTGSVASYIHGGGKIGILVAISYGKPETGEQAEFKTFARDVAMQVAAAQPFFVRRENADPELVAHEMSIYKAQAAESGKPESIQEKMAQGRLQKFFKEVALVEQAFVKNPDISVGDYAAQTGKALGDTLVIVNFTRFVLGETSAE
ncbi:MAG: elongation factor Ts [Coriobacteriia bacterium]|nr:elongation factor Ts [Coriobacteriia bacterium]